MSARATKHPVNLDLSTQRLFIHPDAPLPKFHPTPKAVMVTPIYDYDGPIPSPPTSPADEEAREKLYMYGFNAAHDAMHNGRSRSRHRPNKLQRRYSSYSPGRGRSKTRHSVDPYASTYYPSSQPSQSYHPPSQDYRARPPNDPLALNPPNYQIQATGQSPIAPGGRTPVQPQRYNNLSGSSAATNPEWDMRARPANDPLVLNPPNYQVQATGQGGHTAVLQQPYSAPAYAGSHSAPGPMPLPVGIAGSHHGREPPHSAHVPSYTGTQHVGTAYTGSHHPGTSYAGTHAGSHHPGTAYAGSHGVTPHGNVDHVTHNGLMQSSHAPSALHSSKFPLPGMIQNKLETRHAKNKRKFDSFVQEYLKTIPLDPEFCLSRCTGGKKAVCIGINYVGQRDELKGCANDARAMRDWLIHQHHFPPSNILLLTDDDRNNKKPSRRAIFEAAMWLVQGAKRDDSLFFHYSGHGGQAEDASGREADGQDEVIFPVDFEKEGDIIDDELYDSLVRPLPAGCRLTAIFDSCHSGTVLDLPYVHSAHGRLRSINHVSKRALQRKVAPKGDVLCFAACRDDEKSADTFSGGVAVGAMSHVRPLLPSISSTVLKFGISCDLPFREQALLEALHDKPTQTYDELLTHLRDILIPKYGQKAQVSGSHPLDLDERFTL
ncbi:metacaspase-1 [Coprinopsis sp. MPI-PUGE-AT-0042]|nr:metacaspase-1 [Coprinopsis sp. MPI-PUGE-AT-0042]